MAPKAGTKRRRTRRPTRRKMTYRRNMQPRKAKATRRRRKRTYRRNQWYGQPVRHSRAARFGSAGRRTRRKPGYRGTQPRATRRRKSTQRRSYRRAATVRRSYRRNPNGLQGVMRGVQGVFTMDTVIDTGFAIGGAYVSSVIPDAIWRGIPALRTARTQNTGWVRVLTTATTAGGLGALLGTFVQDKARAKAWVIGGMLAAGLVAIDRMMPGGAPLQLTVRPLALPGGVTGPNEDLVRAIQARVEQDLAARGISLSARGVSDYRTGLEDYRTGLEDNNDLSLLNDYRTGLEDDLDLMNDGYPMINDGDVDVDAFEAVEG